MRQERAIGTALVIGLVCSWALCASSAAVAASAACPVVTQEEGTVCATSAIPTGDRSTSVLLLEKMAPTEVRVGQSFDYDIKVTNLTPCPADDVVVTDRLPTGFRFVKAVPKETEARGNRLQWNLGTLEGKASKLIRVSGTAVGEGEITMCASVAYTPVTCATLVAINPALRLVKTAPAEVMLCDPIPVKWVVTNTGSGAARNVKVTDTLPAGMVTADGQRSLSFDAGNLDQGQSREFTATLKAEQTGKFTNNAAATADAGLKAQAAATTVVRQPVLALVKASSRPQVFLGQTFMYGITVSNQGDAPAQNTTIRDELPRGTTFKAASDGGQLAQGAVVWNVGTLAPEASKKVTLTLKAADIGTVRNTAKAEAVCAAAVSATETTKVVGIPAILLEVIDLQDPVEVGDNTTYVITATNQGSANGTNVQIKCTFEATAKYVTASGATQHTVQADVVTFAPLPSLAPQAKATWKVEVNAVRAGDVRFAVAMTSDQISRPVDETEATNFYE